MVSLHELGTPISQDELRRLLDDPRKPLASLQGNILKGHGRNSSGLMFLRFKAGKLAEVKNWIRNFSERITSAQQQLYDAEQYRQSSGPGPLFTNFFLSAKGYEHLFPNIRIRTRFDDQAFLYGMRAAQHRLNDPPLERFEQGFQHSIDAMVLLAHDEESSLRQAEDSLANAIQAHTEICVVEHGRVMRNGQHKPIEHFGFVDGSSQPLFFEKDVEQEMQKHRASDWNPGAGPNLVLVPDPFGRRECDCGSYMVFRKLEQNVLGFKTRERQLATALGLVGEDAKRAGALVMGRFEDGTPLALHSTGWPP